MLSVQNCKYKTNCLPPWSNSSFFFQRPSRDKGCIYKPLCWTVSLKSSFLQYAVKDWNKWDREIRNPEAFASFQKLLLSFKRSPGNSIYKIYDLLGIKLLTRLQLGFSHLAEHKFRHNFADSLNLWNWAYTHFFSMLPKL